MATTIINSQKVENFAIWKKSFNAGQTMREKKGIIIKGIFQSVDDENSVTIISEVSNPEMAKTIMFSSSMKEAMEKSGVISTPEIKLLNQIV